MPVIGNRCSTTSTHENDCSGIRFDLPLDVEPGERFTAGIEGVPCAHGKVLYQSYSDSAMRKGLNMTLADAQAHAKKHGYDLEPFRKQFGDDLAINAMEVNAKKMERLSRPRQNKTELAFGLILEAQKLRGEIVEYRPFGIRLEWGKHPESGKPQVYTPDFTIIRGTIGNDSLPADIGPLVGITLIETKGAHIWQKDLIRFRGCRAEWPMFQFELWQKKAGSWKRLE